MKKYNFQSNFFENKNLFIKSIIDIFAKKSYDKIYLYEQWIQFYN